jgi:hemerythrin-like domain-containing protein
MSSPAPIKRHEALVSFSREHHFGLLLVWKIRQGLSNAVSPDRIGRYIIYFFTADLRSHFSDEETFLFTRLTVTDPLRLQAEEEHRNIYNLVEGVAANISKGNAVSFADIAVNIPKTIAENSSKEIAGNIAEATAENISDESLLRSFADTLEKHIRFEERILFNHLQSHMSPADLEEIVQRMPVSRDPDLDTAWTDLFWLKAT